MLRKDSGEKPRTWARRFKLEESVSWLWRMCFFSEIESLVAQGQAATESLLPFPPHMHANNIFLNFQECFNNTKLCDPSIKKYKFSVPRLGRALHMLIFRQFWVAGAYRAGNECCTLFGSVLIKYLVSAASKGETYTLATLAAIMTLNSCAQALFLEQFIDGVFETGSITVSAASSAVFRATLSLKTQRMSAAPSSGQLHNVLSSDAHDLREFVVFFHNLWACPLLVIACMIMLLDLLGAAGLVACVLLPLVLPLESWVAEKARVVQKSVSAASDARLSLVNELLDGFKTVKLTGLVPYVFRAMNALRDAELSLVFKWMLIQAVNLVITKSAPLIITLCSFAVYTVLWDEYLPADRAFAAISIMMLVGRPLTVLPKCVSLYSSAMVSCSRIEDLIEAAREHDPECFNVKKSSLPPIDNVNAMSPAERPSYHAVNLNINRGPSNTPVLKRLSLASPLMGPGLVVVLGDNASGKTTLLLALLNELKNQSPKSDHGTSSSTALASAHHRVAFMGHESFILSGTARANILLANPSAIDLARRATAKAASDQSNVDSRTFSLYAGELHSAEEARYAQTVSDCALREDFLTWPQGENTLLGEKGLNASGGQKQRVCLARALMSSAPSLFLDAPLSSLDPIVARSVFQDAIAPAARTRLVVMTTHDHSLAKHADRVLVLREGTLAFDGTNAQLERLQKQGGPQLLSFLSKPKGAGAQGLTEVVGTGAVDKPREGGKEKAGGGNKDDKKKEKSSVASTSGYENYAVYFRAATWLHIGLATALSVLAFTLSAHSDYIVSSWTTGGMTAHKYLLSYFLITLLVVCFNALRFVVYARAGNIASTQLHHSLLEALLGSTCSFFDERPSGYALSRFSNDLKTVDTSLIVSVASLVDSVLGIVVSVGVVCISAPYYAFIALPLFFKYKSIQQTYRHASTALKLKEGKAVAPLMSFARECFAGLETIRAYELKHDFVTRHEANLDAYIHCRYSWDKANRWLGIRLGTIGALIVGACAFCIAFINAASHHFAGTASGALSVAAGGQAGLMLSYAAKATFSLSFAVRASTALDGLMISCERISDFLANAPLETKPGESSLHADIASSLPSSGVEGHHEEVLVVENINASYTAGSPLVLKNVSVTLTTRTMVAVNGRTGCGKSSLALALARALPLASGKLVLKPIVRSSISANDSTIAVEEDSLAKYRQAVQLFPQESYILSGSIRCFLDPYCLHSDARLTSLLQELSSVVPASDVRSHSRAAQEGEGHYKVLDLNSRVSAGGSNLSAGEKQVVVLARAALTNARVLILDEITSQMDVGGAARAMRVLKRELSQRGVASLIVTHREDDIKFCDQVWTMDNGVIVSVSSLTNSL